MWIHELTHLLDQGNIRFAMIYIHSNAPTENLKAYLLKYRDKSIANLYYLLSGNKDIVPAAAALDVFHRHRKAAEDKSTGLTISNYTFRKELYSGNGYYTAGPWIVLLMMQEMFINTDLEYVHTAIPKIERNEPLAPKTIREIIRLAGSYLTPHAFLDMLQERIGRESEPSSEKLQPEANTGSQLD